MSAATVCPNRIDHEESDGYRAECGDEGRLCEECFQAEAKKWSRHFGQDYGTREERRTRLMAMAPLGREEIDHE